MSLQAAIEAELPFLRSQAESRMVDTFEIRQPNPDGEYQFDEFLQRDVQDYDVLFTTPGRVKSSSGLVARESEVGGRASTSVRRELHIPVSSATVPVGAIAVPLSLHSTSDPSLAGAELRIAGSAPGSQTTARRLEISEVLT